MALTPRLSGQLCESFIKRNLQWLFQMSDHVRPHVPGLFKAHEKVAPVALCHTWSAYLMLQMAKTSVTVLMVQTASMWGWQALFGFTFVLVQKNLGPFHFFTIFSAHSFNTSLLDYFILIKICSRSEYNIILKCKQALLGLLNQIVSPFDSWLMLALLQGSTLEHTLN